MAHIILHSEAPGMKRIFMLSSQLLFSRGVEDLLRQQTGVEIVGHEADPTKAIEQIRELAPDVVILDSKDLASTPASLVALILNETPDAKVIALNLENDRICVYRGEQRTAQSIDDLREVIDEDNGGPGSISAQEWMALAGGRAQVYGFLAMIYNRAIDEPLLEDLGVRSLQIIGSLEQGEDLTGDLREGMHALERFQQEVANRPSATVTADLAEEYARLLQGDQPKRRPAYACESTYVACAALTSNAIYMAVNKAYAEGGLALAPETLAQPDFIGCEQRFMQHLCLRECDAWAKYDRAEALKYQALERAFLKDHLVRWGSRFCDALAGQTKLDFYRAMAHLTRGFILNEAYRVTDLMEWICPGGDEPERHTS
jgi:TorA maturation chaperone TorD